MEVIKLVTGIGEPLVGRLLLYDALGARFDVVKYKRLEFSRASASPKTGSTFRSDASDLSGSTRSGGRWPSK